MANTLAAAQGPGELPDLERGKVSAIAKKMRRRAAKKRWPPRKLAAGLLGLARLTILTDEEAVGLELGSEALRTDPSIEQELPELRVFSEAELWQGQAVSKVGAGDPLGAIECYAEAAQRYITLRMQDEALDCLACIDDLAKHRSQATPASVLGALAPVAFVAELALGPTASDSLQSAYARASGSLGESVAADPVFALLQLAKSHATATALFGGARYDTRPDGHGQELLSAIAELRDAPAGQDSDAPELVARELVQASVARGSTPYAGTTSAERLANLQVAFDQHAPREYWTSALSEKGPAPI